MLKNTYIELLGKFTKDETLIKELWSEIQLNYSGSKTRQIENSLEDTRSWDEWKANLIKQNPNNPLNTNMDELFNNW